MVSENVNFVDENIESANEENLNIRNNDNDYSDTTSQNSNK